MKKRISDCSKEFLTSSELENLLQITQAKIGTDEKNIYVHIRDFLKEVKKNGSKEAWTKRQARLGSDGDLEETNLSPSKNFNDQFESFAAKNRGAKNRGCGESSAEDDGESSMSGDTSQDDDELTSGVISQDDDGMTSGVVSQDDEGGMVSEVEFVIEQRKPEVSSKKGGHVESLSSSFTLFEGSCEEIQDSGKLCKDTKSKGVDKKLVVLLTDLNDDKSETKECDNNDDISSVTSDDDVGKDSDLIVSDVNTSVPEDEDPVKDSDQNIDQPQCSPDSQGIELIGSGYEIYFEITENKEDETITLSQSTEGFIVEEDGELDETVNYDGKDSKEVTERNENEIIVLSQSSECSTPTENNEVSEDVNNIGKDASADQTTAQFADSTTKDSPKIPKVKLTDIGSVMQKLKTEGPKYISLKSLKLKKEKDTESSNDNDDCVNSTTRVDLCSDEDDDDISDANKNDMDVDIKTPSDVDDSDAASPVDQNVTSPVEVENGSIKSPENKANDITCRSVEDVDDAEDKSAGASDQDVVNQDDKGSDVENAVHVDSDSEKNSDSVKDMGSESSEEELQMAEGKKSTDKEDEANISISPSTNMKDSHQKHSTEKEKVATMERKVTTEASNEADVVPCSSKTTKKSGKPSNADAEVKDRKKGSKGQIERLEKLLEV